jgi:hypothetical protein
MALICYFYTWLQYATVNKVSQIPYLCDQIASFIQNEWTPIYTFQFAWHFAHANLLLMRFWNSRKNQVKVILLLVQSLHD